MVFEALTKTPWLVMARGFFVMLPFIVVSLTTGFSKAGAVIDFYAAGTPRISFEQYSHDASTDL
jgi:hypothetical protein